MRAAVLHAPGQISADEAPDPSIAVPTDAIVRITASCICGSDLWHYRGKTARRGRIGHEFVGVVEDVGADVTGIRPGTVVIAPFVYSCGVCPPCRSGWTTSCLFGGDWGRPDRDGRLVDGGQGQYVRVPWADGTLVPARVGEDDDTIPALLALSDVLGTGHHAAVSAGAGEGRTLVVVGDGAVGLCAVLAAARLGTDRVIVLSTHPDRSKIAETFGATDIVAARGDEAVTAVRELTAGIGADGAAECVGTTASWETAIRSVRPGGTVGYVGVPHGVQGGLPLGELFGAQHRRPRRRRSGPALPAGVARRRPCRDCWIHRRSSPHPSALADIADGYKAMDERTEIKVLVQP